MTRRSKITKTTPSPAKNAAVPDRVAVGGNAGDDREHEGKNHVGDPVCRHRSEVTALCRLGVATSATNRHANGPTDTAKNAV
jgi:hypothetical protein